MQERLRLMQHINVQIGVTVQMSKKYKFLDFSFETEEEMEEAKKEHEKAEYIRSKTDFDNPQTVFRLYTKLIEKKTFKTPVGIAFLRELRRSILAAKIVPESEVPGLPLAERDMKLIGKRKEEALEKADVSVPAGMTTSENMQLAQLKKDEYIIKSYREKCRNKNIVIAALAAIIAGMFIILATGFYSPFTDWEEYMINKYASWQEDLTEQKEKLDLREYELDEREKRLEALESKN